MGGGTPGEKYEGRWFYEVVFDGDVVEEGNDLTSGTPHTARYMAGELVELLASTGASWANEYRLANFVDEMKGES
jgi:hypothetical protein